MKNSISSHRFTQKVSFSSNMTIKRQLNLFYIGINFKIKIYFPEDYASWKVKFKLQNVRLILIGYIYD